MTTITYDGEKLAADSLLVGNYKSYDAVKIHKINENHYCACSGDFGAAAAFVKWLKEKGEKPVFKKEDFEAIEISDKGLFYWDCYLVAVKVSWPIAIGSGSSHAITAMDLGKGAIEAISFAMLRDPNTGGEIKHVLVNQQPQ